MTEDNKNPEFSVPEAEEKKEESKPKGQVNILPGLKEQLEAAAAKKKAEAASKPPVVTPVNPVATSGPSPVVMPVTKTGNETVDKLEAECAKTLKEYGGLEGNIPVSNNYWGYRNQIRAELNKF